MAPETRRVAQSIEHLIDVKLAQVQKASNNGPVDPAQAEVFRQQITDAVAQLSIALQRLNEPQDYLPPPTGPTEIAATEY
jgi:hypothetical protein